MSKELVNEKLTRELMSLLVACPNEEMITELINQGANPNATYSDSSTPLMHFTGDDCVGIVKALVNGGAKVGIQGPGGVTPIMVHVEAESYETLKVMLDNASLKDLERIDDSGKDAVEIAEDRGATDIKRWLQAKICKLEEATSR